MSGANVGDCLILMLSEANWQSEAARGRARQSEAEQGGRQLVGCKSNPKKIARGPPGGGGNFYHGDVDFACLQFVYGSRIAVVLLCVLLPQSGITRYQIS